MRGHARARDGVAACIGAQDGFVDLCRLVAEVADEDGARDVGAQAVLARAEVDQQRVAGLDRVVGARLPWRCADSSAAATIGSKA